MHPATVTPVVPTTDRLPVVVVGAGPVGLAAAARLAERGESFLVLERGVAVGAAVRAWGHVGMFSPWRYNVDKAARRLLDAAGWRSPDPEALPTGRDLVDQYLVPLARHAAIAPFLRFNAEVEAIGRKDFDKVRTKGRDVQPFELHLASGQVIEARAVIDASGTWGRPNPAGSNGLHAVGERESADRIWYGIPDVLGGARPRFAGKRVMVVGSGHSAINVVLDLKPGARGRRHGDCLGHAPRESRHGLGWWRRRCISGAWAARRACPACRRGRDVEGAQPISSAVDPQGEWVSRSRRDTEQSSSRACRWTR